MVDFGEGSDLPHVWGWYGGAFPFLNQYDNGNMDGFDLEGWARTVPADRCATTPINM